MRSQVRTLSLEVATLADICSSNTHYSSWLRHLLWTLLCEVAGRRAPEIIPVLSDKNIFEESNDELRQNFLHATNIWFHLLRIAEESTVARARRSIERDNVQVAAKCTTPSEREEHIENLRNEIDMLWLTGELRFERPTPAEEINWANRFFKNAIFQAQIDIDEKFRRALVGIKSPEDKMCPSIMFHS